MEITETQIPGCFHIHPNVLEDQRGHFVKIVHKEVYAKHGLTTEFAEEYYSVSHRNVLRGLHFQLPPHHHVKLVYCIAGRVMDVVVDLRRGSPAYGDFATVELHSKWRAALHIPAGLAHGFYVLSDQATLVYKTTTVHAPRYDAGIRWDSIGITWPGPTPVVSERDNRLPPLSEFKSPFVYRESESCLRTTPQ